MKKAEIIVIINFKSKLNKIKSVNATELNF